jgi:DNA end-binding protein Ku
MVTIPIRLYTAVDSGATVSFNQLHKKDNGRVGYDKKCKSCGEVLSAKDIVKGYEHSPDEYVVVEEEDLQKLKLKSTKIIEIEGVVDAEEVHETLYDTPYYAGPDGEVAVKVYALLNEALKASGKLGVGKVVMRDREDMVLIGHHEGGLVIYKLRYPQRVRQIGEVPGIDQSKVNAEELKLAQSLVDSMSKPLAAMELKDTYNDAIKDLINAKVEGKEIVMGAEEVKPVVDIMSALKDSIEQAKEDKKPMKKAAGEKAAAKKAPKKKAAPKKAKAKKVA